MFLFMKNASFVVTFFLSSLLCSAQDDMLTRVLLDDVHEGSYHMQYDGEKAYLLPEWKLGRVFFKSGNYQDLIINYNGYNQRLERKDGEKILTIDTPTTRFILGDTSLASGYLFINGLRPYDSQDEKTFYQLLHNSGNFRLLKHVRFNGREERQFNEATTKFKFNLYENYYIAFTTGQIQRIKKSKKEMLELFPKYEEQVEAFIDKEKLKFKNWNDVATVFDFVETLF